MMVKTSLVALIFLTHVTSACVPAKNADSKESSALVSESGQKENWLADLVAHPKASSLGINRLVIFGDSLSDVGNLHKRTFGIMLPPHVFYKSRFSNGPIWADYVQAPLKGWNVENFAVGGAKTSDNSIIYRYFVPSLQQQVAEFIKKSKKSEADSTLVAIWIGPNNYMKDASRAQDSGGHPDSEKLGALVAAVMGDLRDAISQLRTAGYSHFILGTMPELGVININPAEPIPTSSATLFAATAKHNDAFAEMLKNYESMSSLKADVFRAGEINQSTIENPRQWGFTKLDEPCFVGNLRGKFYGEKSFCSDPSGYKFWEYIHPNTKMHCYYASQFLDDLQRAGYIAGFSFEQAIAKCKAL